MHKIIVDKQCGCFKREGMPAEKSFESKDDALIHASEWVKEMNETFCKKHSFTLIEEGENFRILFVM